MLIKFVLWTGLYTAPVHWYTVWNLQYINWLKLISVYSRASLYNTTDFASLDCYSYHMFNGSSLTYVIYISEKICRYLFAYLNFIVC